MTLDAARFLELGLQVYRLVCVAAILLSSPSATADPSTTAEFKKELKRKLYIIMDNAASDT